MSLLKELQKKNFKEAVDKEGSILSIERSLELKKKDRYKLYRFLKNGNCADISLIVSISRFINLKIKNEATKGMGSYQEYSVFLNDFSGKKEMSAIKLKNDSIIHLEREYAESLLKFLNSSCNKADENKGEKNGLKNIGRGTKKTRGRNR